MQIHRVLPTRPAHLAPTLSAGAMTTEVETDSKTVDELRESWPSMTATERIDVFEDLDREEAVEFFLSCSPFAQARIIEDLPESQKRLWLRLLAPDDAADVMQEVDATRRTAWVDLLDDTIRREVQALLAYAEDEAGGLMNPRYARVRPDMTVDQAIRYLRQQARQHLETIYYVYVIDEDQMLRGVISFRELFRADPAERVHDVMNEEVVTVPEKMDQEEVAHLFDVHDLLAMPVLDSRGRIQGIVTFDDIVDVVREEATEDVQKIGGMEALETPYMETSFFSMIKKRAGWLAVLFFGLMLTASAIEMYEEALSNAVVLSVFIPMIIASGGNSGSQAATLVVRALAVDDVKLRDWTKVLGRELWTGLGLGALLGVLGFSRVLGWEIFFGTYGEHASLIALTVSLSLTGVVTWATLVGAMLPFMLEKFGFDSASASVPLLATLVDVTGLLIYFNIARIVLSGTML